MNRSNAIIQQITIEKLGFGPARSGELGEGMQPSGRLSKSRVGQRAHRLGIDAEAIAFTVLRNDGWTILGRRVRTKAGEIDIVAEKNGLLSIVEVKARPTLADAAQALAARQRTRLLASTEALLAEHPDWGHAGVRLDVLVVDRAGRVRRISDAFRRES